MKSDQTRLPEGMDKLTMEIKSGRPIPLVNTFGFQDFDFTTINGELALTLAQRKLCGICGDPFHDDGVAFLGGPAGAEAKTYSDPPMHPACAEEALKQCPHMARQGMRRASDNHVRQDAVTPTGMTLKKPNRWVMTLCTEYTIHLVDEGDEGQIIIYVPTEPTHVRSWAYTGEYGQLEEE